MKKIQKRINTFLAVTLAFTFLLLALPLNAFAQKILEVPETPIASKVVEINDLRESNVKHFKDIDGTYKAVMYDYPVHRINEDGEWQDIDNALSLTVLNDKEVYATADMRSVFAKQFSSGTDLITISDDKYAISMGIIDPTDKKDVSDSEVQEYFSISASNIINAPARASSWNSMDAASEIYNESKIKYQNIKTDIDLEYILNGNDVKENIIVKSRQENYVFDFFLRLSGLTAKLNEDGSVSLADNTNGREIYNIPSPYMYDNSGNVSYAVSYELTVVKNGLYVLRVSADNAWINHLDRAFPVVIDPTVFFNPDPTDENLKIKDTYIATYSSDTHGDSENLTVGTFETTYYQFNLPNINGRQVTKAELKCLYYYDTPCVDDSINLKLYRVGIPWEEDVLTNQYTPMLNSFEGNTLTLYGSSITAPLNYFLDFTNLAVLWYSGQYPNYGLAIKRTGGTIDKVYFKASESTTASYRPFVRITYEETFDDGIYMFRNRANPNMYLDTRAPDTNTGALMQQRIYDSGETPGTNYDRSALFKISKVSNGDEYIIRLMSNNALTFDITDTNVVTKEIPLNDSSVLNRDTFIITYIDDGYVIQPYASGRILKAKNNYASGSSAGNDSLMTYTTASPTSNLCKWELVKYDPEEELYDVSISHQEEFKAGKTVTMRPIVSCTVPGMNVPTIDMTNIPSSTYTLVSNGNNGRKTVAIHQGGSWEIDVSLSNGAASTVETTVTLSFQLPFDEGQYMIRNFEDDEKFLYNPSSENANILLTGYVSEKYQVWEIDHIIDGYYTIKLFDSDLYLTAPPLTDQYIEVATLFTTAQDRQLWILDKDQYYIKSKYYEDTDNVPLVDIEGGSSVLIQGDYTDDNDMNDAWKFDPVGFVANIDHIAQENPNWCWVACTKMFSQYYADIDESITNPRLNYSQQSVAAAIRGLEGVNEPGTATNTVDAIDYWLNYNGENTYAQWRYNHIFNDGVLDDVLNDGNIIVAGFADLVFDYNKGKYVVDTSVDAGHFMLIIGCAVVGAEEMFIVVDPAQDNTEMSYLLSYDDLFIYGVHIDEESGESVARLWDTAIIANGTQEYQWMNAYSLKYQEGI